MRSKYLSGVQPGNWVWVHSGRTKLAGQVVRVDKPIDFGGTGEVTVRLKDGKLVPALQRELRRCREPKRVRNADWFSKNSG
jgi:hypothetical protein